MSTATKRKLTVNTMTTLRRVIPVGQFQFLQSLLRGEEREFFVDAMTEIEFQYNDLPIIGSAGSDQPTDKALAKIHLFGPSCDWWLVEKPSHPEEQFFGIADLGYRELGYIPMDEIIRLRGVEIDLHWKPKTVQQILDEATL